MATTNTAVGDTISSYVQDALKRATAGATSATQAGFPAESALTQQYYAGVPSLYQYGNAPTEQALGNAGDIYSGYGAAGGYNKTDFSDIGNMYKNESEYDPANFQVGNYMTQNIQNHMSPYEQLVSQQAQKRLLQTYQEGQGTRDTAALRSHAFGGSGAAIQDELARRDYENQAADMNAKNLQSAFESGSGLVSKENADALAAQQDTEASRQFAQNQEMAGIQGLLSTRQQTAAQEAAAKEAQLQALQGQTTANAQQGNLALQDKNMHLSDLGALQTAGQQQQTQALNKQQYPLQVAGQQANILSPLNGGSTPNLAQTQTTSLMQNVLGGATAVGGLLQGLGGVSGIKSLLSGLAGGGMVKGMADGGKANISDEQQAKMREFIAQMMTSGILPRNQLPYAPHNFPLGPANFRDGMENYRESRNVMVAPPNPPQQVNSPAKSNGYKAGGVVNIPKPSKNAHSGIAILIMPHH